MTTPRTIHAAQPGLPGDHRTDGLRCPCDPHQLIDLNEPSRIVVVHRRSPGRPAGPEITRTEILAALASRRRWILDAPTQRALAADLGVSRARLRDAVGRNFGDWRQLVAITTTHEPGESQP